MSDKKAGQSLNIFELIEQICTDFRKEWKKGARPRIGDFVTRVPEDSASHLFQKLLLVELRYRERQGEEPSANEYLRQFADFKRVILETFHQSVSIDEEGGGAPAQGGMDEIADTIATPTANSIGEYKLIRELGRGAFGIVYEAVHEPSGNRVALKTLPSSAVGESVSPDRLRRFRREFRALAEINHPNLVGMQTLELDDKTWFFTMDLVEGSDFLSYVRPDDVLDESRLRSALSQLVQGIIALHDRRIIHRDLKPSNVLVDSKGRLAVLDFGLVAEIQRTADATMSRSGMFAGTPRYAAPEQMFGDRSEASDWYAIGTMIYEALTGGSPFSGNQMEILRQKQEQDPDSLIGEPDHPKDLAELVDGLLKRDPQMRPTRDSIVEFLKLDLETRLSGSTHGSISSSESAGDEELDPITVTGEDFELIGRDEQLAQLEHAKCDLLEKRRPMVVWITGQSGEGKSALANRFLQPLRRSGEAIVLSGRCYERESIPFKAVDCWMDPLATFLKSKSDAWLRQLLPDDITGLAQIFPILQRVEAIRQMPSIENQMMTADKLRHRAFAALTDLLRAISSQTPIIVFVDDLQWGDADSVAFFERLIESGGPPAVLFMGSYRSEEMQSSPFLRQWNSSERSTEEVTLETGPLNEEQALSLVERLASDAGKVSNDDFQRIFRESGGSPYILSELVESFDPSTGKFQPVPLNQLIAERLSRLPRSARPILEMLTVAGHDLPTGQIELLSDIDESPFAVLTRMRNEKLVRLWGSGDVQRIDTYHDKIRETFLDSLDENLRRHWHLRIAEKFVQLGGLEGKTCEDFPPEDPFDRAAERNSIESLYDLAYHFHSAGDPRGLDYQLLAGEESLRLFSNVEAIGFFENALSMAGSQTAESIRFRLHLGLGLARERSQRVEAAIDPLLQAVELSQNQRERILSNSSLGVTYNSLGEVRKAIERHDVALVEIGRPRPRTRIGLSIRTTRSILRLVALRFSKNRRKSTMQRESQHESEILFRCWLAILEDDLLAGADCAYRASVVWRESGEYFDDAIADAFEACSLNAFGNFGIGKYSLNRFRRLDENNLPADILCRVIMLGGQGLYFRGLLNEALEYFRRGLDAAGRCGDNYNLVNCHHFVRHSLMWIGRAEEELQAAESVLDAAQRVSDCKGMFWGHYDCADALSRAGQMSRAAVKMQDSLNQMGHERWYQTEAIFGGVHGYFLLQCSEPNKAELVLSEAWNIARTKLYFIEFCLRCLPILLESCIGHEWLQPMTRAQLRKARKPARWCRRLQRIQPVLQTGMLRSLGRLAASQGQNRRAVRLFERAISSAQKRGMLYYKARALLDLAAVKEVGRDENRANAIQHLKEMESVIPRAESWLLGDQYSEKFVAQEFDLAAWEAQHGSISPLSEND